MDNPSMGSYSLNTGIQLLPVGPAVGTTVTPSATPDTYGNWTQMSAGLTAEIYIVGISALRPGTTPGTPAVSYVQLQIGLGGAGVETVSGSFHSGAILTPDHRALLFGNIVPFIYVPQVTRIACRVAWDGDTASGTYVTLSYILKADLRPIS